MNLPPPLRLLLKIKFTVALQALLLVVVSAVFLTRRASPPPLRQDTKQVALNLDDIISGVYSPSYASPMNLSPCCTGSFFIQATPRSPVLSTPSFPSIFQHGALV
jgi:hypothetical protein